MGLRLLYIAEIVGKPGIFALKTMLPELKERFKPEVIIGNGDGVTNGFGIGKNHAMYLRKIGIDVISGGDQTYYKKDLVATFDQTWHVIRPANYPPGNPGRGWRVHQVADNKEKKLAVISLLGLSGFNRVHLSNPYTFLPEITKRVLAETPYVVLDFHSVTTAEKATMNYFADGKLSAVLGSGIKAQTADAEILPGGTAVISDCGRTGSILSVGGFDPTIEIDQFMLGVPQRSFESWEGLEVQGCFVELDDHGKAIKIEPFRLPCKQKADPAQSSLPEEESPAD